MQQPFRLGAWGRLEGSRFRCPGCEWVEFGGGEGCGHNCECGTGSGAWIVWAYRNFADTTNIGCPRWNAFRFRHSGNVQV